MNKITELHNYLSDNNVKLSLLHLQVIENIMRVYAELYHKKQLLLHGVVKSLPSKKELVLNAEKYVSANKDISPFDVGVDSYIKGFTESLKINYKEQFQLILDILYL